MKFEDIKEDAYTREMLNLTLTRIRYINEVQTIDDKIQNFLDLIDVGGFVLLRKKDLNGNNWFHKNCKSQRKRGAKICKSCPFCSEIENINKQSE